ncbi:MAG: uncharacterized protein KVP18_001096 [Porospora cf. gigantea A]|uniref:uncharacterized protein n=1 Tax=Porospora cf. gigantea A TaxID=2853593 RepID=UPI0035599549|nr:MAG: hypothetical protein KVP18_001096 [Porospora cf. gigantea A]
MARTVRVLQSRPTLSRLDLIQIYRGLIPSALAPLQTANLSAVAMCPGEDLYLSGCFCFQVLRGSFMVFGSRIEASETVYPVARAPWSCALPVECISTAECFDGDSILIDNETLTKYLDTAYGAVLLLAMHDNESARDVRCVVKGVCPTATSDMDPVDEDISQIWKSSMVQHKQVSVRPLEVPDAWKRTIELFLPELETREVPSLVVDGPKGSGKSTFCTFAVNALLNWVPSVLLLDCDLGQPLIGPPTTVSLQLVSKPLLSSDHFEAGLVHPQASYDSDAPLWPPPESPMCVSSVSLAEVSPLQCPVAYIDALRSLVFRARHIVRNLQVVLEKLEERRQYRQWRSRETQAAFEFDQSDASYRSRVPVIVNLSGYNEGLGAYMKDALGWMLNSQFLTCFGEPVSPKPYNTPFSAVMQALDLPVGCWSDSAIQRAVLSPYRLGREDRRFPWPALSSSTHRWIRVMSHLKPQYADVDYLPLPQDVAAFADDLLKRVDFPVTSLRLILDSELKSRLSNADHGELLVAALENAVVCLGVETGKNTRRQGRFFRDVVETGDRGPEVVALAWVARLDTRTGLLSALVNPNIPDAMLKKVNCIHTSVELRRWTPERATLTKNIPRRALVRPTFSKVYHGRKPTSPLPFPDLLLHQPEAGL